MITKNYISILVALILLLITSAFSFAAESAIQIYDWEDLYNVRNDLAADYLLMNNLNKDSVGYTDYVSNTSDQGGWIPIGEFVPAEITGLMLGEWDANFQESTPFTGSFNGQGHTVSDLYINRPDAFGQGLFGYVRGAQIVNLSLVNADISGHRHIGILAGYAWQSSVMDIHTSGDVYANHNGGGIAGTVREDSYVQDCSSSAIVIGDVIVRSSLRTGGLIGAVHSSTVQNCSTSGTVTGDFYDTGGLAGSIYGTVGPTGNYDKITRIVNCHTTGTVYGTGAVGGLIGSTNQGAVISNSSSASTVIASGREIGGLIGNTNNRTQVIRSFATGEVSGNGEWVGGLVGIVCNSSVIEQSYATGNVRNGNSLAGGLVGHLSTGAEIHDSYATGDVIGAGGVGGLVGLMEYGTVSNCYSTGSSTGNYAVGGLVGARNSSTVNNSYWDIITSGLTSSSGGTGLITSQMVNASSYPGWDFENLWKINTGETYPYFIWQGSVNVPYAPGVSPNNPPIAANDSFSVNEDSTSNIIDVLANDSDPDGDSLAIVSVTDPAHGTASITGNTVSYTPDADYYGTDSFTYTISDGKGGSDTATVTVTVTEAAVNSSPDAVNDSKTVDQDSTANIIDVLANDSDPDGDPLTIISVTDPAHGTASIVGNTVSYTPDAGYYGTDSFTYTISDGKGGSDTATVTVTVTEAAVNSSPDAVYDSKTVDQDSTSNDIDVLANDSDPDGDPLTIISVTDPAHGTASIVGNTVSYTPDAGYYGTDSFTYTISDGKGGSDTATVTVTVTEAAVNSSPDAVNDSKTVDQDSTSNDIDVLANDSDPDGDPLTIVSVTDSAHGTASITGNTVSYTPDTGYYGTDSFNYTISDSKGGSDSAMVTVLVVNNTVIVEIDMSIVTRTAGKNTFVRASAEIDVQIENATVQGSWSGVVSDSDIGITDGTGSVILVSDEIKYRNKPLTFTFTIEKVIINGVEFVIDGEIKDTIIYPN